MRFLIFVLIFLLSACSFDVSHPGDIQKPITISGGIESTTTYLTGELDPAEKVQQAKKRRVYMDDIRKADYFSLRNQSVEALAHYLGLLEKLPGDHTLIKKVAGVYYDTKEWGKAYEYYSQIAYADLGEENQKKYIQSMLFHDASLDRRGIIEGLPLSDGQKEYYKMIDTCYTGIHNCIITIMASSGSGSSEMTDLKSIVDSYEKVSPDYQYRNLLVAAKLFEQSRYRASAVISEEILKNRPDYQEATKLLGLSYSRLGQYELAKKTLLKYLDQNPKDIDTIVALGEVTMSLGDYITSNLYLNTAITTSYTPKIALERKLAYNYLMMDDDVGLLKVMGYMLQRDEAKEDDFVVGVSIANTMGEGMKAYSWASDGLRKYPQSSLLLTARAESLIILGRYTNALQDLSGAITLAPKNVRAQEKQAVVLYFLGQYDNAKSILLDIKPSIQDSTLSVEVEEYLSKIDAALIQSSGSGTSTSL